MADIDNLQIKLSASAQTATQALDSLISKVDKLSKTMGNFDTKGIQKFGSGMQMLTNSMQGMSSINASVFTKTAKGIQKFEQIDGKKLSAVANSLQPLATSIGTLSTANFDSRGLSTFINSLTRLSNANMSSLNGVDFTRLGNSINGLTQSLSNAKSVSGNTISMVNAIAKLGASGGTIGMVSSSLPALGSSLRSFFTTMSQAPLVATETITFTNAIGTLASAGARAKTTASNLGYLATELKRFFTVMSTAPTVNQNIIQMTQALGNLASQGSRVGSTSGSLITGLNGYSASANRATASTKSLASAFGKFYANWFLLIRAFKGIGEAITLSSDLTEVQNVVDKTFAQYKGLIEDFADTSMYEFGMSELTSKQIASRYQAMGVSMGFARGQMAEMSIELTALAGDLASFYNQDVNETAKALQAVFTGETEPLMVAA